MTPERWTRLTELFEAAIERDPAERSGFLHSACADDAALRRDVERLIDSHEHAGDFGTSPAFRFAPAAAVAADAAQSADVMLRPGSCLGRYEIVALVGSGGMSTVYRARDPQLGREVAVKVLRHRGEITTEQLKRFEREARAVGALNHPNILAVYDLGVADGVPYVVSELLEGRTLREHLLDGLLPLAQSIEIALQIASGLSAAHEKGIVHRDVKPDNLFVTTDGLVKILDFGLAKQSAPFSAGGENGDSTLTEPGLVMGTAGYMSPEQVRGREADARSDVFAFGAVLYEMLAGLRAFTGDSPIETMNAILTTQPAALSSLPQPVASIARKCLEKDADGRFASMREVDAALQTAQRAHGQRGWAPGTGTRATRAAWLSVAAWTAAFIGVVVVGAIVSRGGSPPRPGPSGRPAIAVVPLEDHSGDPAMAWLSDGLSSMLVTALAQTPGLDVIGSQRLEASLREIGREASDRSASGAAARHAGAGALLVGSLYKAGTGIRLDVRLEDVETGRVVAAGSEQGQDVFAVVDAVANRVRTALDVANRPASRPLRDVTTASLAAYELYAKAQQARHNNRWSDARTLFEEALRLDPAFTLARAQLVNVLERLGETTSALAERRVVRSQLDRLPERQRLLAGALQEYETNPSSALELLERLLERYPDEEEAYDVIVHAYTHSRDPAYWKKALAFMQRWARAIPGPGSGHFHNHYGYAYIEHGLFTEAEREFRAYIRVSPDEANGYDSLAELFLLTGRPAMAVGAYDEALRLNPLFGWSHFGRAYGLAAQGRYDDALGGMTTLRSLGSRAAVPGAVIGMVDALLYSRVGRYAEAAGQLNAARRLARELGDAGAETDADLMDAVLAVERGQHARAIQYADRAAHGWVRGPVVDIMRARRAALAHLLAGVAESRAGRIDAAHSRSTAQRQLDVSSDPIQVSWQQALMGEIALAQGRADDAETAFKGAEYQIGTSFAIYPAAVILANNLPTRDGVARAKALRGEIREPLDVYRRLNQPDATSKWTAVLEPRFVLAAARLAARAGDRQTAHAEYHRFLELWKRADRGLPELTEARRYRPSRPSGE